MPLQLAPVSNEDFDTMLNYVHNDGGDLIAPLVPVAWPTSPDDAANAERNAWSLKQQREMFHDDPTTTYLKVIDLQRDGEIIALARWHFYERGWQHDEMLPWELNGRAPDADRTWPQAANASLFRAILEPPLKARTEWMGQRRMWVLSTLITKEPQRKRGAGGMLVKWGVDKAKEDNVPAFLEATPAGQPLYEKFGFRRVGETSVDLSQYGMTEPLVLACMAANLS